MWIQNTAMPLFKVNPSDMYIEYVKRGHESTVILFVSLALKIVGIH